MEENEFIIGSGVEEEMVTPEIFESELESEGHNTGEVEDLNEETEGSEENEQETDEGTEEDVYTKEEILKAYGIDGTIDYGGEQVKYDELDLNSKVDVLEQLLATNIERINDNDSTRLDENEIGLINYLRTNNVSLEDVINEQAQALAREYIEQTPVQEGTSFGEFTEEQIFQYDYLSKLGDLSELSKEEMEEIEEDMLNALKSAKSSSTFDRRMEALKNEYLQMEDNQRQQAIQQEQQAREQALREEYDQFISRVEPINELLGFVELEPQDKQFVIDKLYSLDDEGNSTFYKEMLSTPEKLFETIYLAYNGKQLIDNLNNYYQNLLKEEVSKAKKEVLEGKSFPRKPVTPGGNKTEQSINNLTNLNDFQKQFLI